MYNFQTFDEIITTCLENDLLHEMFISELNILGKKIEMPNSIKNIVSKINIKSSISEYKKYMSSRLSLLKKSGVDINSLRKEATVIGKSLKTDLEASYKKGEDPKKVAEKLKKRVSGKVNDYIKKHIPEIDSDLDTNEKLGVGLALIIGATMINTVFYIALTLLFGPVGGMALTAIFVGPVIEEAAKSMALQMGIKYGKQWTFVFASVELVNYVINGLMVGMAFVPLLIGRLLAVLLHMATVSVQAEFVKKDKTFIGYVLGVIMHMAWNTMAVLGSV